MTFANFGGRLTVSQSAGKLRHAHALSIIASQDAFGFENEFNGFAYRAVAGEARPRTTVRFSVVVDDGMTNLPHLANIVQRSLGSLHR